MGDRIQQEEVAIAQAKLKALKRQAYAPAIAALWTTSIVTLIGICAIAYSPRPLNKPLLSIFWSGFVTGTASIALRKTLK